MHYDGLGGGGAAGWGRPVSYILQTNVNACAAHLISSLHPFWGALGLFSSRVRAAPLPLSRLPVVDSPAPAD